MTVPFSERTGLRVLAVGRLQRPVGAPDPLDVALRAAGYDPSWSEAVGLDQLATALRAPVAQAPEVVLCLLCPGSQGNPGAGPSLAQTVRRIRSRVPHAPLLVLLDSLALLAREDLATLLHGGVTDVLFTDQLDRLGQLAATALAAEAQARRDREARGLHHQSAMLLSGLVHHAPAAICVRDRAGHPLVVNSRYQDLVARGLPEPDEDARQGSSAVLEVGGSTVMALAFPMIGAAGRAVAHGEILMDITEQKRTESELIEARAELERQAAELRASNADLVELDRLKTDLVSTVSHELRTPLTSILGYTELLTDQLADQPSTADQATLRMIEVITRNSSRLLGLIDNLLVLARLDGVAGAQGDSPVDGAPVDLVVLVDHVRTALAPAAAAAGLELRTDLGNSAAQRSAMVCGDGEQLERALLNLASNAVKFSAAGGVVTLAVAARSGEVVVEVRDQGIGIAPEELPRLGTRFFRSEAARVEQVQGSGLGLSVVQGIAARHGGRFEIESELGVGTVARLRLPAC